MISGSQLLSQSANVKAAVVSVVQSTYFYLNNPGSNQVRDCVCDAVAVVIVVCEVV